MTLGINSTKETCLKAARPCLTWAGVSICCSLTSASDVIVTFFLLLNVNMLIPWRNKKQNGAGVGLSPQAQLHESYETSALMTKDAHLRLAAGIRCAQRPVA